MRIATWNVNSLKARLPARRGVARLRPRPTCCACRRRSSPTRRSRRWRSRRSATSPCTTATASGTAWRSCRASASTNVTNGFDDEAVDPYEGDARLLAADVRRRAGRQRLRAERARGRHRVLRPQARVARDASTTGSRRRTSPDDPTRRARRLQRRARGPRRVVDPKAFDGLDPRDRARARGGRAGSRSGASSTRSGACTPTTALQLLGLPRAATSTSTAACASTSCSRRAPVAERVTWAVVDRNARKGKQPSDHAPVIVDFA